MTERAVERMREDGLPEAAVEAFASQLRRLRDGETGLLPEAEIEPLDALPALDELPDADLENPAVREALDAAVVLRLNGGLGTSMGLDRAKSLLEVRPGRTFLDLIALQVLALRERSAAQVPLVLMNSFRTREASLEDLAEHPHLALEGLPLDFLQNRVPKLDPETLEPADAPSDELAWAPPGHGDLYAALDGSGMLDALLDRGVRWAFVANADNLGATLDLRILAWMAREEIPFCMEAARRTAADRKGGHLARRADDGRLVLREVAQTPDDDLDAFQDTSRHRFFNTNSLWLDLRALRGLGGAPQLPLIVNRKTVDPADKGSAPVVQLETAMGAAIGAFDGARALEVPRSRFAPVKTTDDLIAVRSDAYEVGDDGALALIAQRDGDPPDVRLDPERFKLVGQLEERFPHGPPSLRDARSLEVRGDVRFGQDVVVRGDVVVEGPRTVADGEVLEG